MLQNQLHLQRCEGEHGWDTVRRPVLVSGRDGQKKGRRANMDRLIDAGTVLPSYQAVPLKKVPVRVAKYDVALRETPLRAAQAMHAILSRMVLFVCNDCRERFPTFHPAYVPPPSIADDMEVLKRGKDGVAACNVEVATWDELPPLDAPDGVALCCSGTCRRCPRAIRPCWRHRRA